MAERPKLHAEHQYDVPTLHAVIAMLGVTDLDDAVSTLVDGCEDCGTPPGALCERGCNCLPCSAKTVPTKPF